MNLYLRRCTLDSATPKFSCPCEACAIGHYCHTHLYADVWDNPYTVVLHDTFAVVCSNPLPQLFGPVYDMPVHIATHQLLLKRIGMRLKYNGWRCVTPTQVVCQQVDQDQAWCTCYLRKMDIVSNFTPYYTFKFVLNRWKGLPMRLSVECNT